VRQGTTVTLIHLILLLILSHRHLSALLVATVLPDQSFLLSALQVLTILSLGRHQIRVVFNVQRATFVLDMDSHLSFNFRNAH
jgi:hypothetical protein